MLMYSLRFNRRARRSVFLLLSLLAVIAVGRVVLGGERGQETAPASAEIQRQSGKTEEQRQQFLAQLGWQVDPEPMEVTEVVIPRKFDEVYESYNALQTEQGMDLTKYRGKRCHRYSYVVKNHPTGKENIRLNLLVCKNKIIGGDVCSLGLDGFLQGLAYPQGGTVGSSTAAAGEAAA